MAQPYMQIDRYIYAIMLFTASLVGCDFRGGSRVVPLTEFDRFRIESIKLVADEVSGNNNFTGSAITMMPPDAIRKNQYVLNHTKIDYLFRADGAGVLLYETNRIRDIVSIGDKFRNMVLCHRPDGEIRFLSPTDWEADMKSNSGRMKSFSFGYK
jgi:hypothetical protein